MSRLFKYLNIIVFLLLFQICLYSQNANSTIASITFEGLKRTKISTIEKIIQPIEVGSQYTSNTTNQIAQKLNQENIFKPFIDFDVATNGNDVDITVYVEDRWTIVPAPLVSFSNTSWFLGFYITESNFLGYNKDLFLMFFYGSTGWHIGSWYKDAQFIKPFIDMNVYFDGGLRNFQDIDVMNDDINVRLYQSCFFTSQLDFLFNVIPRLKVGIGAKYNLFWDINKLGGGNAPLTEVNSIGFISYLEYKLYNYQYPFEEGVAVRLNGGYQFGIADSPSSYSISGEVLGSLIIHDLQRIGGGIFGGFGNLPAQLEFRMSGTMGAYLIPQTLIAADYYSAINIFYEAAFVDWSLPNREPFGRMGIQIFYEAGLYDSDVIDFAYYHGPGAALLLYLNSISIPALEVRVGYNIVNRDINFRVGVSRYL